MKKTSRKLMLTGTMITLLVFMVSCSSSNMELDSSLSASLTPTSTISPISTDQLDPKAALVAEINQGLDPDSHNQARLINVIYGKPEKGDIAVSWDIIDKGSQAATCEGAKKDAVTILKAMADTGARYIYVELVGLYGLKDNSGKVDEITAMTLGINKSTLDQVDWKNFQSSWVYDLADIKEIHPWFQ